MLQRSEVTSSRSSVVILFGAGASYGCGPVARKVPPLGQDLFDAAMAWASLQFTSEIQMLQVQHPLLNMPPVLQAALRRDIETGMATLLDGYDHLAVPLMKVLGSFFATFRPAVDELNLYRRLLVEAQNRPLGHRIVYASLNYECLFEETAAQLGLIVEHFPTSRVSANAIRILKPHGSCNYLLLHLDIVAPVVRGSGTFEGTITVASLSEARERAESPVMVPPAMSLILDNKPTRTGNPQVAAVRDEWANEVLAARTVVVIGVRPLLTDPHIWEPLAKTSASVHYVGGRDAFSSWASKARPDRPSVFEGERFETAMPTHR